MKTHTAPYNDLYMRSTRICCVEIPFDFYFVLFYFSKFYYFFLFFCFGEKCLTPYKDHRQKTIYTFGIRKNEETVVDASCGTNADVVPLLRPCVHHPLFLFSFFFWIVLITYPGFFFVFFPRDSLYFEIRCGIFITFA